MPVRRRSESSGVVTELWDRICQLMETLIRFYDFLVILMLRSLSRLSRLHPPSLRFTRTSCYIAAIHCHPRYISLRIFRFRFFTPRRSLHQLTNQPTDQPSSCATDLGLQWHSINSVRTANQPTHHPPLNYTAPTIPTPHNHN